MKAIVYSAFGNSDVIKLIDTGKPEIKDDEILIKAAAASVNPAEIKYRDGSMQARRPIDLPYIPGLDVAGTIVAVGKNVSRLKDGDKVYGGRHGGTYAEFVALPEENVSVIPDNMSMNEAAALVVPIVTAYSFLIENGNVKEGDRILIHGAAGGAGAVMLQMAKNLGAYVIGTASGDGVALARSLGADEVIDYKKEDFTTLVHDVDLVIDLVGGDTLNNSFGCLKKGGKLFTGTMALASLGETGAQHGVEAKFIGSAYSYKKLDYGRKLVEDGKIRPQIAKTMKLEDAAKAQDLVSAGGLNGKVILEIS